MTALSKKPAAIRVVLPFVFRHWPKQPGRGLDRILVFDRGEIVEQGTHAVLAGKPGVSIAACSSARWWSPGISQQRNKGAGRRGQCFAVLRLRGKP
ncbi:hypothetical protein [Bradyrhizobium sp. 199]|uniref:hypothetical protein n=1 Tax=Bradyrhizobium sp. 199 TaxID=2782664 RepID=UPI001FFB9199|nr:hypothetical protein [Bradyrhizobium sp. 199]